MSDDGRSPDDPLTRFLHADSGAAMFLREVLSSVLAVAAVGALLFAVAGVWPPMVAVESGSMEPHMERGDLVFITEPDRFSPEYAYGDTGVVTYRTGQERGYTTFGSYGSVIVYHPPGGGGPPIIHRARFHVEKGENWIDRANPDYLPAGAETCEEVEFCPAPYAGFITKGDANAQYDQVSDIAPVVKGEWVRGVARVRVPYLGYVRLLFSETVLVQTPGGVVSASTGSPSLADASGETVAAPTGPIASTPPVSTPPVSTPSASTPSATATSGGNGNVTAATP